VGCYCSAYSEWVCSFFEGKKSVGANCSVSSEWIPSFSKGRKGWAAIVVYLWSGNS